MHHYRNRWLPTRIDAILDAQKGSVLDVGGGAAPAARANHILDLIPFDADRLKRNAWGGTPRDWTVENYTVADLCSPARWPFADGHFDLGLCSHTLEDLRDPLLALSEMSRVCRKLLIIAPSRLLEQTKNIAAHGICGFPHHPWIVEHREGELVFRRKTQYLHFRNCHLTCPFGKTLPVEAGTLVYHGEPLPGREEVFWSADEEVQDYRKYLEPLRAQGQSLFVREDRPMTWRRRVYHWRQRFLGAT